LKALQRAFLEYDQQRDQEMLGLNAQADAMLNQNQKLIKIIEVLKDKWNEEVARLEEMLDKEKEKFDKSKNILLIMIAVVRRK
jgi:hypothetical protein